MREDINLVGRLQEEVFLIRAERVCGVSRRRILLQLRTAIVSFPYSM